MNTHKCPTIEEYKALLKKHSLKATPQRLAVHEAMMALGHACADMVTEFIKEKGEAKVTVASVYNILTHMAMLGVYSYRLSANNKMYFDVNTFKHIHFYDTDNHTFRDVIDDELVKIIESHLSRKRVRGYKIEGFDIQLVGRPTRKKIYCLSRTPQKNRCLRVGNKNKENIAPHNNNDLWPCKK